MASPAPQRRLAAILAADVVGYSRLIERDEAGTVACLRADRQEFIDPTIVSHGGRIVRLAGDGALVEFPSVVEAVQCAVDIQRGMPIRNGGREESAHIVFRIGVNTGDILVEDDNLHGEGINVAARLEGLAEPGGILVSERVAELVEGRIDAPLEFVAERTLKNIQRPVRVWRISAQTNAPSLSMAAQASSRRARRWWIVAGIVLTFALLSGGVVWNQTRPPSSAPAGEGESTRNLSHKPSIAVLPFQNMSGDLEQEYFSDGISDDIITDLSRLSNIIVIARNSSFSYKGENVNIQEVGRNLGADFVLEGSVRKANDRLRITAQLVDTSTGHHLWAERYDRDLSAVFTLQDEIARLIVSSLSVQLVPDERRRLTRHATDSFEAYDVFLRGQRDLSTFTAETFAQARSAFRDALALDPDFARAYGALAVTLVREILFGWSTSPQESLMRALQLAAKGVALDPESPQVLWALGFVYLHQKEYAQAFAAVNRAVELAPNYADGYALLALISNDTGRAADAIRHLDRAMALNPHYSWQYPYNLGRAQYVLGDYQAAVASLSEALQRNGSSVYPRLYLAASLVRSGQPEEAEWQVMQLEVNNPEITLSHLDRSLPLGSAELKAQIIADLREAGLKN